jgi:SAM-dependent methyltransferase
MGLYAKYLLPRIVNGVCAMRPTMRQREKIVPDAFGEVLEIGFGTGLNMAYLDPDKVSKVYGLEPSAEMVRLAESRLASSDLDVEILQVGAEDIPLGDHTVDTVLVTYSLCTIPEPRLALAEMARVLRPEGILLFCEHGLAPEPKTRQWQERLNPFWRCVAGGCNLNRNIPALLAGGGFAIEKLQAMYIPGWKPASFNYWGRARAQ